MAPAPAEWLVILIFGWKLRQFGETLKKYRDKFWRMMRHSETGIIQGITRPEY